MIFDFAALFAVCLPGIIGVRSGVFAEDNHFFSHDVFASLVGLLSPNP